MPGGGVAGRFCLCVGGNDRSERARDQGSPAALFRSDRDLSHALYRPELRKLARLPEAHFRLEAVGADHDPAQGLLRLRQRGGAVGAERRRPHRHRASAADLRDLQSRRALLHHHEPRDGARRDDGRLEQLRRLLAHGVPRQARTDPGASGIDSLQLSRRAARHRAALVSGRQRRLHGDLDGRRLGPRPGRLRRDGVPRHGARQRAFLLAAGTRGRGHPGRFPGRRQRLSLRHALLLLPRSDLFARQGGRMAEARRRQRGLLFDAVRAGVRQAARCRLERLDHL